MCGIFGLVDSRGADARLVERAARQLRHRGPDDEGFLLADWRDRCAVACGGADTDPALALPPLAQVAGTRSFGIVLAHRRLSILDLSPAGHQPMASADGRLWLTFNGEIYNYVELRAELARRGHAFRTGTDTEVLLAAYAEWGSAALARFVGMFAFALLDLARRELVLARDQFGVKPLYYARPVGGGLAFSSEPTPLLQLPGVTRRADPQRVYDYLRRGLTDHGTATMFADVQQLPAAHYMVIPLDAPARSELVRYWDVDTAERPAIGFADAGAQLRELFLDSVRLHLRSDVALGACLSGGIDSSAIVGAMRAVGGPGLDLHSFTYLADDPALNEGRWAATVSAAVGSTAHTVQPSPHELAADLDQLIAVQGEPFGSTSIYAQHRVFRLAREAGMTVMLDGQGADEQLGGYWSLVGVRLASMLRGGRWLAASRFAGSASTTMGSYRSRMLLASLGRLAPPAARPALRRAVGEAAMPAWLNGGWFRRHGAGHSAPEQASGAGMFRDELKLWLTRTTLPQLLRYEDRNSMAHSIESRVPFLTPDIVAFVLSLPDRYIVDDHGTTKAVFRAAMRGLVPDAVLDRRDKIGFATPERRWLRELRPWVDAVVRSEAARALPVFAGAALAASIDGALEGGQFSSGHSWRALNFIRWTELYDIECEDSHVP